MANCSAAMVNFSTAMANFSAAMATFFYDLLFTLASASACTSSAMDVLPDPVSRRCFHAQNLDKPWARGRKRSARWWWEEEECEEVVIS